MLCAGISVPHGSKMRKFFSDIADAGYIIQIDIVVFREIDQNVERNPAAACFIVGIGPGSYFDGDGHASLGKMILLSEFLESGLASDAHRSDPFDECILRYMYGDMMWMTHKSYYSIDWAVFVAKKKQETGVGHLLEQHAGQ